MAYSPVPTIAEDDAQASGQLLVPAGWQAVTVPVARVGADGDASAPQTDLRSVPWVRPSKIITPITVQWTEAEITSAGGAYAAGEVIGVVKQFSNVSLGAGMPFRMTHSKITDSYGVLGACDIAWFGATVSPGADNAAISITEAENDTYLGSLYYPALDLFGASVGSMQAVGGMLGRELATTASANLFAVMIARTAQPIFTAANGDGLKVTIWVEQW